MELPSHSWRCELTEEADQAVRHFSVAGGHAYALPFRLRRHKSQTYASSAPSQRKRPRASALNSARERFSGCGGIQETVEIF
jgi:hypothetical protein